MLQGFEGALDWPSIMPTDASLSDSGCNILPSEYTRSGIHLHTKELHHNTGLQKLTSAVLETGVSRHNGGPINGLPSTSQY